MMGYILAGILAAALVVLGVYTLRQRRNFRQREETLLAENAQLCAFKQIRGREREDFVRIAENIDQGVVLRSGEDVYKNPLARSLGNAVRIGAFTVDGRNYEGQELLDGRVLLITDVTEVAQGERMRQELTANVSHELKTPLHAISGYAEMMAQGMVRPEDMVSFSKNIYAEAGRMIRLVEDILNLSRLDAGAGYTWETVDLYEKACAVADLLKPLAEKAGVSLILSGKSTPIRGIGQLVEMMIYNLCDNAIKYNRPGGRVELQVFSQNGQGMLMVADTGIGIPKEDQGRVFQRFYRVDKSRSKAVGGTGLGLSIVKHAARIMDGKIQLQSDVDQGTTITVIF